MYCPALFRRKRFSTLYTLIYDHSSKIWTCWADIQLEVNHVPFLLDQRAGDSGILVGHIARENPIDKMIDIEVPSINVFQRAQVYIPPFRHPSKQNDRLPHFIHMPIFRLSF